jgi:hypothetical protein
VGWTTDLLIYFVLCWSLGVFMSWLIEFPMLRVRDRLFPWLRARNAGQSAGATFIQQHQNG